MQKSWLQSYAEIISLGLTVPYVILSFCVCLFWLPACLQIFSKEERDHTDWFIVGVFVSFLAAILDNLFWAIPWTASFLELNIKSQLVNVGVYFNIFFRQGLGIIAASCHVISYLESRDTRTKTFSSLFILANLAGVLYASLLFAIYRFSYAN